MLSPGVNPNFIRQKRYESLLCHIVALTADSGVPGLLGLDGSRDAGKHQNEQHEKTCENRIELKTFMNTPPRASD